jgi:hypothetical protein
MLSHETPAIASLMLSHASRAGMHYLPFLKRLFNTTRQHLKFRKGTSALAQTYRRVHLKKP